LSRNDGADGRANEDWSGRRSDARRNHERVLRAAVEVFTEHGLDATIPQVAERAGVGKATVYRSYPTKADLVAALAQVHVDWLRMLAATAVEEARGGQAYEALGTLLEDLATRLAQDRLMIEVLSMGGWEDDVGEANNQFADVLTHGITQGVFRSDVTAVDVQVLVGGFARSLVDLEVRDPDVWRRYARLVLAALRPDACAGCAAW
jgi:AcrR family transcriptional regulator